MNYLVTGAAGFIGFHVSRALLQRGDKVIGLDNLNDYYSPDLKKARLEQLQPCSRFTFVHGDLTDYKLLLDLFSGNSIDKVCHLAAQAGVRYSLENPFAYQKSNLEGFLNILELCRHFDIKNLVYASSSSVYGGNEKIPFSESDPTDRPVSLYAATKKADELMAHTYHHLYKLKCTGLRFFTVYGPWGRPDMAYFKFAQAIKAGKPIDVYNYGQMERDFTYIDDIADGVLSALDRDFDYEIFNLGNSHPNNLNDFIKCIEKLMGKEADKNYLPMQPGDVYRTYADIEHAQQMLGFNPLTPIETGLAIFVEWYLNYF